MLFQSDGGFRNFENSLNIRPIGKCKLLHTFSTYTNRVVFIQHANQLPINHFYGDPIVGTDEYQQDNTA